MSQPIRGRVDLPDMVLVDRQSILRSRPDAISIDKYREDVIVGKAVGGGKVFKTEARQHLRCGRRRLRGMRFMRSICRLRHGRW